MAEKPIPEGTLPEVKKSLEEFRKTDPKVDLLVDIDEEGAEWLRRTRSADDRPW